MSKNEKALDLFIGKLLDKAKIKFTPNGSDIKEIQLALKSASKKGTGKVGFPEFVGISNDFIIVIENKADLEKQVNYVSDDQAEYARDVKSLTDYAENGAVHYAKHIIENTSFKKVFAFGCSGTEKHHIIKPIYLEGATCIPLQAVENFENFSVSNIEKYYKEQVLGETPPEILEDVEILKKAGELHEMLRNYGQLRDTEKPLVVSAILLALRENSFNAENLTGDNIKTDGDIIFDALHLHLKRADVQPEVKVTELLSQFVFIKERTTLNQKDERLKETISKESYLEKTPLRYFTEYIKKNILDSIIANKADDLLGKFYGKFIRYGGGDGQTLGIVLTPPHITDLFCELVDLKPTDVVFDPCCGTGGYLISAMNYMIEQTNKKEADIIKKDRLHGIEIREDMFAIASTNMILRGDGKSNLVKADFLRTPAATLRKNNYTVGFINPPYSQAKGSDTAHLSEIHFVEHLLNGLATGGRCAIIVPQSTMVGKTSTDKKVKKRLLEAHTLEGVITLNKQTFYGVGTNPCIAIFKAHIPHKKTDRSKFINFENDGYVINKHIGLVASELAKTRKAKLLDCWNDREDAETKFMVKTTIEPTDEWLHSFYYFNDEIPKAEDFEATIADYLTFEFNMIMQGKSYLFENEK